jgi:hypothetical protein
MPHEQPYLDDYHARHRAELQEEWDKAAKIMETQNRAMRTVLNECPFPLRTPETCQECGNEACVKAYKGQNEIWGEDQKEPALAVSTAGNRPGPHSLPALAEKTVSTESRHHGPPVSGIEPDLFVLLARLREDEDMAA